MPSNIHPVGRKGKLIWRNSTMLLRFFGLFSIREGVKNVMVAVPKHM